MVFAGMTMVLPRCFGLCLIHLVVYTRMLIVLLRCLGLCLAWYANHEAAPYGICQDDSSFTSLPWFVLLMTCKLCGCTLWFVSGWQWFYFDTFYLCVTWHVIASYGLHRDANGFVSESYGLCFMWYADYLNASHGFHHSFNQFLMVFHQYALWLMLWLQQLLALLQSRLHQILNGFCISN